MMEDEKQRHLEDSYGDGYSEGGRGGRSQKSSTVYAKKGSKQGYGQYEDVTSQGGGRRDRGSVKQVSQYVQKAKSGGGQAASPKKAKELEDHQMAKNLFENFHAYCKILDEPYTE